MEIVQNSVNDYDDGSSDGGGCWKISFWQYFRGKFVNLIDTKNYTRIFSSRFFITKKKRKKIH